MTNHWVDIKNADVVLIMGGNAAEAHPCGFKWVIQAKAKRAAKLVVVDPRFTRSAAVADYYAPIRVGADIAFLGGMIHYLLENNKINKDYVLNYTNASFLINPDYGFKDGIFTGYDEAKRSYAKGTWTYQMDEGFAKVDTTLQDPNCVFQLMKKHFATYTPDVVERITGTPKDKFLKVAPETINMVLMIVTAVSAVFYVVFGALSDRVGRKPVMLFGMTLMLVAYFPGFHMLAKFANPALAEAQARTPVVVSADPADCSLQFDPVGKKVFVSSCDVARSILANAGVSYDNQQAAPGTPAVVKVGNITVASRSAAGLPVAEVKAVRAGVEAEIKGALAAAGYPAKADPARFNMAGVLGVMMVFVIAATALFGPIAACLVELFPTRVRYTAMSLPYHIGTGWIGGFVPFFAYAIVIGVGNIYSGLWYPFAFTLLSVVTCFFFLPETRGRRLDA